MFGELSERRTMTDAVYDQLKTAIVELRIPPGGEPLREADIAQGLSVSKMPVREALGRLEQDGLVEPNSFRSAVVTEYTARDDLQEIYELREIIEVAAARSAAESMRDQGLADLGRIASECARLVDEGGGPELVRLISEFDTVLFEGGAEPADPGHSGQPGGPPGPHRAADRRDSRPERGVGPGARADRRGHRAPRPGGRGAVHAPAHSQRATTSCARCPARTVNSDP